jgi:creatinine amidohydrolase/Fe(II)-dependent formamide hydrolase-like protein
MLGAAEQHGKHLPSGMDTMGAYSIATSIAEGLGDALVAAVIRPGAGSSCSV